MSYSSDVFLSYRRANRWPRFVGELFKPMFDHWLTAALGEPAKVFFDVEDIEAGAPWPRKLADGVASSKLMVCLWSNEYFHSDWCKAELGHMLVRREKTALDGDRLPLVMPLVIHGKPHETIPNKLRDIYLKDIHWDSITDYASPWLVEGSQKAYELSEKIRVFARHVANALGKVPEHDASWRSQAIDEFMLIFQQGDVTQQHPPSLGGLAS